MRFYELRIIPESGMDAGDLVTMARDAAIHSGEGIKVIGCTIHAQPHEAPITWGEIGCVHVMVDNRVEDYSTDHDIFDAMGGYLTRKYGPVYEGATEFGDGTVSLMKDPDAIEEHIHDALGDEEFSISPANEDEEESFNITEIVDTADE